MRDCLTSFCPKNNSRQEVKIIKLRILVNLNEVGILIYRLI